MGAQVRARISAAEAQRLGEVLGREERVLLGRVVGEESGGVLVQVPGLRPAPGQRLDQRVLLPPAEILEIELRHLDRPRTFGLTAAVAAAGAFLLYSQFSSNAKRSPGTDKPGGDQVIIPVGRVW